MARAERVLNTNSIDGLRALAIMHIVLGHHSIYTGYMDDSRERDVNMTDINVTLSDGCTRDWCTSPDGWGGEDCYAGTWHGHWFEPCSCWNGEARQINAFEYMGTHQVEYTCCINSPTNGTNVGRACGYFSTADESSAFYRAPAGADLLGGISMGLFYCISGFVLMLGYGINHSRPLANSCCACHCCGDTDQEMTKCGGYCCCSCFCTAPSRSEVAAPLPPLDVSTFYWKRFARIAPLWYLGNLLSLHLFFTGYVALPLGEGYFWFGALLSLLPFGLNSWLMVFPPAGHLWTISTMTFFYLIFPALHHRVNLVRPRQLRSLAMTLYAVQCCLMYCALHVTEPEAAYWFSRMWPPYRLPVFVMGMVAARQAMAEATDKTNAQACCGRTSNDGRHAWVLMGIWVAFIVVGCYYNFMGSHDGRIPPGVVVRVMGEVWLPCVYYELLVELAYPAAHTEPPSRLHAFLASAPLRWFADISLAVYVVHQTLIASLVVLVYGPQPLGQGSILMPRWGAAATLPLSVAIGWLLTHYFEKPINKCILRRVLPKRTQDVTSTSAGATELYTIPAESFHAKSDAMMQVEVPAGVSVGEPFVVVAPDGQQMQVIVPNGSKSGDMIQIQAPPAVMDAEARGRACDA